MTDEEIEALMTDEEMDAMSAVLAPILDVMEEINELPCAVCGEDGDTLPCITCDKLLCGKCGEGCRWCKGHGPLDPAPALAENERREE
jgi:hypothetical protein